ncbi:MAG: AI-2E family transporter [Oscillospiraceae bacterium]
MKINTNRKYTTVAAYALLVIGISLLMVIVIFKFNTILRILSVVTELLMPVFWGIGIAFLLNPIMVKTEKMLLKYVIKQNKHPMVLRAISVTICSLVFILIVGGAIAIILPEILRSLTDIFNNIGVLFTKLQNWANRLLGNYPELSRVATEKITEFSKDTNTLVEKTQPVITDILTGAWNFVTVVKDFLLGFIVSIYLLASKEKMMAQLKKVMLALFKKNTCATVFRIGNQCNKVFSGFIIGKLIDSTIVGILTFIGLTVMHMPYAAMIAVLIGVTDIIPFFGPFLGAVPAGLLLLMVDTKYVLPFAIFILVMQQVDGNLISPKILGDSTGLPAFWVIVSLFVGGGLFGFIGMLLCVPTCAILYDLTRSFVEGRLDKKNLPVETDAYLGGAAQFYTPPNNGKTLTKAELEQVVVPPTETVNQAKRK